MVRFAHCGTALTGSKTTIDALGTWMIDFVGSTDKQDLPMALCGTTQITDFQRRSISLHALKELGFDCSHVLTQKGNFLEIISAGNKFIFPLLTINGGDYIEIKIHRPPPETVAARMLSLVWIWLKNFMPMASIIFYIYAMAALAGSKWK